MQITLYRRSYPVAGAPVHLSFVADHAGQVHTYTAGGVTHTPRRRSITVNVPAGSNIDRFRTVLCWRGASGLVRSTAKEVHDHAKADHWGFKLGNPKG